MSARPLTLLLVAISLLSASAAQADGAACSQSYEQAQRLRKDSRLLEARAALVTCSQSACPSFIKKDCSTWFMEVEREIPSVAVKVLGADGCDRSNVAVTFDGEDAPRAAEGLPISGDPGTHTLQTQIDGKEVVKEIVLTSGERGRVVILTAHPSAVCGVVPAPAPINVVAAPVTPPPAETPRPKPVPALSVALGGAGLLSLGVGAAFSAVGWSQRSDLDACQGRCAQDDVDAARRSFVIADVGIGVGLVALAAAAVIYFTR